MRRRIYLMRHAAVAYFGADGSPVRPDTVGITAEGREQARHASEALADVRFDRVITSGLRRTLETARIVAPDVDAEAWPSLRELRPARIEDLAGEDMELAFTRAFAGEIPRDRAFLGGETIGSLVDRVVPSILRLVGDPSWDTTLAVLHGGVNRAILTYALTGKPGFLGDVEQAPACINVLDVGDDRWIVRAVNYTPYDPIHARSRLTTMEELYAELVRSNAGRTGDSGRQ